MIVEVIGEAFIREDNTAEEKQSLREVRVPYKRTVDVEVDSFSELMPEVKKALSKSLGTLPHKITINSWKDLTIKFANEDNHMADRKSEFNNPEEIILFLMENSNNKVATDAGENYYTYESGRFRVKPKELVFFTPKYVLEVWRWMSSRYLLSTRCY